MPKPLNISNPTTMEELLASQPQKTTLDLTRGQEIEGEVVLISDKEITLDLGAKSEAIIPIRDFDSSKIKVGDKLKGYVVEPENESHQIVLSLARSAKASPDGKRARPESNLDFEKISQKYADQIVKGTVTKITQFGVFVQLEEGLEGLIHISKLGPDDDFKPGEVISVSVDSVDTDKKRVALSPVITSTKGLIYK